MRTTTRSSTTTRRTTGWTISVLLILQLGACGKKDVASPRPDPADSATEELEPRRTWWGDEPYDEAGRALDVADWNGDGQDELVVASPSTFVKGPDADMSHSGVYILSASAPDGVLRDVADGSISGDRNGDYLGLSLATDDWTGDAEPDVAAFGIYSEDPVLLFGVFDGAPEGQLHAMNDAYSHVEQQWRDAAGYVVGCGDIWGDGVAALCLTAALPSVGFEAEPYGKLHVFRGPLSAGRVLLSDADVQVWGEPEDIVGQGAAGGHDVTGDGRPDLVLGAASWSNQTGAVYLWSEASEGAFNIQETGAPRWTGEVEGGLAGDHLAMGGDIDEDGIGDFFVSAHLADERTGRGYVVTDSLGGELAGVGIKFAGISKYDWFGVGAAMGDYDGDGSADDLAVGISRDIYFGFDEPGRVALFLGPLAAGVSTEENADLVISASDDPDAFGLELVSADTDGNGDHELLVSAPYDNTMGAAAGAVYLFDPSDGIGP